MDPAFVSRDMSGSRTCTSFGLEALDPLFTLRVEDTVDLLTFGKGSVLEPHPCLLPSLESCVEWRARGMGSYACRLHLDKRWPAPVPRIVRRASYDCCLVPRLLMGAGGVHDHVLAPGALLSQDQVAQALQRAEGKWSRISRQ